MSQPQPIFKLCLDIVATAVTAIGLVAATKMSPTRAQGMTLVSGAIAGHFGLIRPTAQL